MTMLEKRPCSVSDSADAQADIAAFVTASIISQAQTRFLATDLYEVDHHVFPRRSRPSNQIELFPHNGSHNTGAQGTVTMHSSGTITWVCP